MDTLSVLAVLIRLTIPAFCLAAMISDLQTGKIRNSICLIGFFTGFVLRILSDLAAVLMGSRILARTPTLFLAAGYFGSTVLDVLGGIAVPFLLLILPFIFRMIGAGDIKLLMAAGGVAGAAGSLKLTVASLAFGAVISILIMIFVTGIIPRFQYFVSYVRVTEMTGEIRPYRNAKEAEFHFAVPVLMAALIYSAGLI